MLVIRILAKLSRQSLIHFHSDPLHAVVQILTELNDDSVFDVPFLQKIREILHLN